MKFFRQSMSLLLAATLMSLVMTVYWSNSGVRDNTDSRGDFAFLLRCLWDTSDAPASFDVSFTPAASVVRMKTRLQPVISSAGQPFNEKTVFSDFQYIVGSYFSIPVLSCEEVIYPEAFYFQSSDSKPPFLPPRIV